ncbi:PepSY-associated TM helix domain-containing protein [Pseudomonas saudiphocaensis]|uniref:PepSY-associated TM helix domain-containing protein n=1 Tax=Pseudomonas saudiphocaensis TaxID=1499686 RepID=UPI000F7907D9|nr:PepSY-associated TM helix domain-containing protein [Pseudomonas saudiphocaensis]RRV17950.1 PepSY domain-containing protein [Pseudomonas saudiphocaensis]
MKSRIKQKTFTQSMSWLHTWCGLLLGWVLFAIFLTGTIAVFDKELNWWMQPELSQQTLDQPAAALAAQRWLEAHHPHEASWNISLPTERSPALAVSTAEQRRGERTYLDPASGAVLEPRQTAGGNFFFRFHYTLHMPRNIGIWAVGFAAMAMLVALISGIVIHKKIFKEFFTFRPAKGQRSWLDGHNASAVLLLPFHLMITYTGLVIFFLIYMPAAVDALYDGDRQAMQRDLRGSVQMQGAGGREGGRRGNQQPAQAAPLRPLADFIELGEAHYGAGMLAGLSVSNPGRIDARVTVRPLLGSRIELTKGEALVFDGASGKVVQAPPPPRASQLIQRVMAGLHFAQFGGYPMRWLYFLCGLVSCAMIASGLVLYAIKQRKQAKGSLRFLNIVERLNVATVSGLSLACVALLWGNRLLPAELAGRNAWEVRLFFAIWLASLAHAALRPVMHAWREQLAAAALLCISLPLLDLATGLGADGLRLGVDAAALALGLLLFWAARKIPATASLSVRKGSPLMEAAT